MIGICNRLSAIYEWTASTGSEQHNSNNNSLNLL